MAMHGGEFVVMFE